MTDKSRIVVIVVVAMLIILAVTAFAYGKYRKRIIENQASGGPHIVENTKSNSAEEKDVYTFNDVLESATLLGKSVAESGIEEKYFDNNIFFELKFNGTLFSKEAADCSVVYNQKDNDGEYFADTVYIYSYEIGFDEAVEELTEIYGEPTGTGEEPYVKSNGGAVSWANFEKDGIKVILTQGSENDYISITLNKK